jgi:hypothetical protein
LYAHCHANEIVEREHRRRHMLDQAATFERADDAMAPPQPPVPHAKSQVL